MINLLDDILKKHFKLILVILVGGIFYNLLLKYSYVRNGVLKTNKIKSNKRVTWASNLEEIFYI